MNITLIKYLTAMLSGILLCSCSSLKEPVPYDTKTSYAIHRSHHHLKTSKCRPGYAHDFCQPKDCVYCAIEASGELK